MTAHRQKPTITPARVAWFRAYYQENQTWGVFHVALDDGNFECGAADVMHIPGRPVRMGDPTCWATRDKWPADIREHAEWFETLTQSQKRRLRKKAETRIL